MNALQDLRSRTFTGEWLFSGTRAKWWYYAVLVGGIVLQMAFARPRYTWNQRALACIPLVILISLLQIYLKQRSKTVPMLIIVAVQIYIFYSVPQFTQEGFALHGGDYFEPSEEAVTSSMLLVVLGEMVFILGFVLATRASRQAISRLYRLYPTPRLHWIPVLIPYTVLAYLIFAWTALRPDYIPTSIRYTAGTLLSVYLALTILLYLGFTHEKRQLLTIAYLLAAAIAVVGFIQGLLGAMIGPFLVVFLSRWIWGRTFSLRSGVLIALAAVLINPVKDEFRMLAWVEKDVSSFDRIEERLENWADAFENVWISRVSERTPVTSTASRANDLLPFAQAIDYVPAVVPYNGGDGFKDALLFWIPRVIWPSKKSSSDLVYNRYAVDFGFTDFEGTKTTTVGASVFTEGFWNFDAYGVIAFLLVYGLILGVLFGNNGRSNTTSLIICIVYAGPSIFILQALTVAVASLFSFLVGTTLAFFGIALLSNSLRRSVI